MNDHEDSREAFEAGIIPTTKRRDRHGDYESPVVDIKWQAWTRALDWRDAQVCPTTFTVIPVNHAKIYSYQHECGGNSACVDKHIDFREANPFCPACGRRVKIVDQQQTNDTNEQ